MKVSPSMAQTARNAVARNERRTVAAQASSAPEGTQPEPNCSTGRRMVSDLTESGQPRRAARILTTGQSVKM
jgi:hypothetical protein